MNEDQFRTNYKKAVNTMTPEEEMTARMEKKLEKRQRERKRPRKTAYIVASLALAACIGLAATSIWQPTSEPAASPGATGGAPNSPTPAASPSGSVVIPKMELPDMNSGVQMSMIPLIVYQNGIYTQSSTRIDAADATALRGDRLGRTTGGIDEWSGQDEYIELASNIGEADIYAVNEYDPDFRIMSYVEIGGEVYAELFERTNDMTISSGADLFGKLNLEGRVASAQWESFDSWNNGLRQYAPLAGDEKLDSFLSALQDAKPLAAEPLIDQGVYDDENRKIIYLKLEDRTRVELTLFGRGWVRYGHAPVFFEVDSEAFRTLWESMNP